MLVIQERVGVLDRAGDELKLLVGRIAPVRVARDKMPFDRVKRGGPANLDQRLEWIA
jgi:hypothetical protein